MNWQFLVGICVGLVLSVAIFFSHRLYRKKIDSVKRQTLGETYIKTANRLEKIALSKSSQSMKKELSFLILQLRTSAAKLGIKLDKLEAEGK